MTKPKQARAAENVQPIPPPKVSVIVVNWNGKKWLEDCFNTLMSQTYKNTEVIFVDNGSSDDSVQYARDNFPTFKVVTNAENLGFAGGNDVGLKHCTGDYIYLLNNDTRLESSCIEIMVDYMQGHPEVASAQSKMILMSEPGLLDVAGSYWTNTGFLFHYGYGGKISEDKYNKPLPFFSNKGASMMVRAKAIEKVGFFDQDFWCYYEETDLCHRLWIAGYECWYVPKAVMYHAGGGTALTFDNDYIQFHNFKNKLLSFLKNFEIGTLIKFLPIYLALNIAISIYWLFSGKAKHSVALYKAIGWNIKEFPATLRKRRVVQGFRMRSDKGISDITEKKPAAKYYLYLLTGHLSKYAQETI